MKELKFKKWNKKDVENYLDELSKLTGLDWRCMELVIDSNMDNSYGEFHIYPRRKSNGEIKPKMIKILDILLNGYIPENLVKNIIAHEFMHFYTIVKENKFIEHNKVYRDYCKKFGFDKNVYQSTNSSISKYIDDCFFKDYKYLIKCKSCGSKIGQNRINGSIGEYEKEFLCGSCGLDTLTVTKQL